MKDSIFSRALSPKGQSNYDEIDWGRGEPKPVKFTDPEFPGITFGDPDPLRVEVPAQLLPFGHVSLTCERCNVTFAGRREEAQRYLDGHTCNFAK